MAIVGDAARKAMLARPVLGTGSLGRMRPGRPIPLLAGRPICLILSLRPRPPRSGSYGVRQGRTKAVDFVSHGRTDEWRRRGMGFAPTGDPSDARVQGHRST